MMNSFILQAVEVSAQATFNEADLWHILLVSMIGMIAYLSPNYKGLITHRGHDFIYDQQKRIITVFVGRWEHCWKLILWQ